LCVLAQSAEARTNCSEADATRNCVDGTYVRTVVFVIMELHINT
jgi:hypothetical protein